MTTPLRDADPWPAEGSLRVELTPPPAWDEHTVDQPNGHVYQSLEWAGHRAASGWLPRYVVVPGGPGVLALLAAMAPDRRRSARTSRAARSRPARRPSRRSA